MWNGMFSPNVKKSTGFLDQRYHDSNPLFQVTDVIDGFAQVVVYFNHTCEYHGKTYFPSSNETGYLYEYQVGNMDAEEVESDLYSRLGDNPSPAELLDILETS